MWLFPRLTRASANPLAQELHVLDPAALERRSALSSPDAWYGPTGGTRIPEASLAELREGIREAARACRYGAGDPAGAADKSAFDAALARQLHAFPGISAHEAAQQEMWWFITCVLVPEIPRWRFAAAEGTHLERYLGSRVRNTCSRLWWRARLLRDESRRDDPLWLLDELGEDEQVQIMERTRNAGDRQMNVHVAKLLVELWPKVQADWRAACKRVHGLRPTRSALLQELLKRILRLRTIVAFEVLDEVLLHEGLVSIARDTLSGVGLDGEKPTLLGRPSPPARGPTTVPSRPEVAVASSTRSPERDPAAILERFLSDIPQNRAELLTLSGLQDDEFTPAIQELLAAGRAARIGKARGTRYTRASPTGGNGDQALGAAAEESEVVVEVPATVLSRSRPLVEALAWLWPEYRHPRCERCGGSARVYVGKKGVFVSCQQSDCGQNEDLDLEHARVLAQGISGQVGCCVCGSRLTATAGRGGTVLVCVRCATTEAWNTYQERIESRAAGAAP